ncbi:hypothetical protein LTR27_009042 [Elasticomyces elasticus]|nr:hypothetical protein LTR27_009042 [Elasticomyces elasticus]
MENVRRAVTIGDVIIGDLTTLGPSNIVNAGVFLNNNEDQASKLERCRDLLFVTDPEVDRAGLISAKGTRVSGTCEWIWRDAAFKAWRSGNRSLLCISGGPGKGKTIMAIYLTECWERKGNAVYYFCSNDDQKRNNAAAVLRGLIWHIITRDTSLVDHLLEPLSHDNRAQATLGCRETLWGLFIKILQDYRMRRTACVLDGLDECDADSQHWLVAKIQDLEFLNTVFKLAIVSRPLPGLNGHLQIRLDPDNEEQVGEDITRFVAARVHELAKKNMMSKAVCREVRSTLLERSEGTFLWVGFAMLELFKQRTITEILEALHTLPKGLPSMYSRMLTQIDELHRHTCTLILKWVTMAVRPLTVWELAAAIGTDATAYVTQEQAVCDQIMACGPLIRITADTVGLVHQSAKDYLLQSELNPMEGHLTLARACVKRVEQIEYLGQVRSDSPEAKAIWEERKPMDEYAIQFWPSHAKASGVLAKELLGESRMFDDVLLRYNWWLEYNRVDEGAILPAIHLASYLGIVPWVSTLIKQQKLPLFHRPSRLFHRLVNSHDSRGRTPLWWATLGSNEDTTQLLISNGARLEVHDKAQLDDTGVTLSLVMASLNGQEEVVKELLANGAHDNGTVKNALDGCNALKAASLEGHEKIVRLLLASGANYDYYLKREQQQKDINTGAETYDELQGDASHAASQDAGSGSAGPPTEGIVIQCGHFYQRTNVNAQGEMHSMSNELQAVLQNAMVWLLLEPQLRRLE